MGNLKNEFPKIDIKSFLFVNFNSYSLKKTNYVKITKRC